MNFDTYLKIKKYMHIMFVIGNIEVRIEIYKLSELFDWNLNHTWFYFDDKFFDFLCIYPQ